MRQGSLLLCMAVSPRGRGVSPRIAGSAPGLQVLLRGCRFSPSAADSAPGPRVLLRGCGFYSGAADSYLYNGRRSLHGALPEGGGVRALFKQDARILCRGGAYRSFANRVHGPYRRGGAYRSFAGIAHGAEGSERPGRKAFAAGCKRKKEKSVFTRKIRYFFLFLHQLGK